MGFFSALLGNDAADAARDASQDTYKKQQEAIDRLINYGNDYASQFKEMGQGYDPYIQGGQSAYQRLLAGLGLGSPDGAQEFTSAYRSTPGYQAGLETGSQAITGNAAAKGMLNSGATLKALQKYGSNYEDQRSGDYLTRLMGLGTQGLSATGAQNATTGQGLQGQLGTRTTAYGGQFGSAGTIGQGMIAGANAQAQGAQNLLNTGTNLFGKVLGSFG